jgi:cytochrome c oxidase cbb3-type subunit 1
MATITAPQRLRGTTASADAAQPEITQSDDDHGLARFFFASAVALILSAVQGVIQRMPGISDWLRDADYGGHMVTNLAHTHITIVGAGTICLTALIYYVLPRVCRTPLYSKALTNVSFWATIIGVFGFYVAMLSIGIYEGAMVHAGWPYESARDWMGAWHKAPMAITAAIMGIGYWTFVTNVYVTVARGAALRRSRHPQAATDDEFLLAKFFMMAATGLLIGTVQGVYQVMPWMLDWLQKTGEAGHMIDPMSHAHMNLVGGVSVAVMGLMYYFLPRMMGRPIFSQRLAVASFWCIVVGVFGFYLSAIVLGAIEGNMVLAGMTDTEAREAMGVWHPLLLASTAAVMGLGFWLFTGNALLTLGRKPAPASDAPPDAKLRSFLLFSTIAIFLGTVQGVIQILEPVEEWLEEATSSGYLITPLAHAQLNMVGFAIISLSTFSAFLLPRVLGRQVQIASYNRARRALLVMAVGISLTYLVYLTVGLLESIQIHNGATPGEARAIVAGTWGRYALFMGAQAVLGLGYLLFFVHVARVIGAQAIRGYFRTFGMRIWQTGRQALQVHPRALPSDRWGAQKRALGAFFLEALGGALGFLGMGWLFSGRPFIGIMLLGSWAGGFWTFVYVVLAAAGGDSLLPVLLVPYFTLPVLSGISAYRTYIQQARRHLATA